MCGLRVPGGFITTTSAQMAEYLDLGWNIMPCFMSSPQFLSLAISKSSLLLEVICACCAI